MRELSIFCGIAVSLVLPWIHFAGRKNWNLDQTRVDKFIVLFILINDGSQYKTNNYIAILKRQYHFATLPNTECIY